MPTTQSSSKKKTTKKAAPKAKSSKLNKKVALAKEYGLSKDVLVEMLRNITLSRKLDDAEISMRKQSKAFFQISGAGHEGILTAVSQVLKPKYDYFIPYYRDRALCTGLGVTAYEMLCQANGNIGDTASHGRQMPAHWGNVNLNIVSKSSCTGTQFLQACGVAEAGLFLAEMSKDGVDHGLPYHRDEIVYTSCGDGTTSQGEFWEALTTACVNKLPVMFMVEDNGFAISVPTSVQTPEGSISKALANFPGLKIYECDGTCPIESYATVKEAEEYMRAGNGPTLVHAHVTRPYSHSLSDDHSMYRTKEELADEAKRDVITTFPKFLVEAGFMSETEVEVLHNEVKAEVQEAMKKAIETEWPALDTHSDHLYSMDIDPTSSDFETEANFTGKDDIPMASAINMTLRSEISKNPLMRMFGEDVADFSELEKLDDPNLKGKGEFLKSLQVVRKFLKRDKFLTPHLLKQILLVVPLGKPLEGLSQW
jgi:2-oxoisovalerate dehydrogenase E1 component